ncbi:MAG: hypothetical protein QGG90_13850, partial [Nitrospinota bacterium]|nr:hypothetical protein [Nitrospinota bacterium]
MPAFRVFATALPVVWFSESGRGLADQADSDDADFGTLHVETDAGALLNTTVDLYANDCEATWSLEYDGDGDGTAV